MERILKKLNKRVSTESWSLRRKFSLLLPGLEPETFQSWVQHSTTELSGPHQLYRVTAGWCWHKVRKTLSETDWQVGKISRWLTFKTEKLTVLMSSNSPVVETIKSTTKLPYMIYIYIYIYIYKCVKLDEGWKLSPNAWKNTNIISQVEICWI